MQLVFHGTAAAGFREGFEAHLASHAPAADAQITVLPDVLTTDTERAAYAAADIVVSVHFDPSAVPAPPRLQLFHVPGAGYDAVDLDAVPAGAMVCNCFGHETAMAEYVMAALLAQQIPLVEADRHLREGNWSPRERAHGELGGTTIGLLGFGRIGRAIASRAKAFDMTVHVANRSAVPVSAMVDRAFTLDALDAFWRSADCFVVSLPATPETLGIVGTAAFSAMRPSAVLVNVGRGATVDEQALYDALKEGRIGGAVIDTWYVYPSAVTPTVQPSRLPFHELPNVVMTPHMSALTHGTIRRRQRVMAENIGRRLRGDACLHVVREPR
jgi:phosphoglycerate dehydrogenase-like enzyme